jgi:beta-mannosidase
VHINGALRDLDQASIHVGTDAVDAITLNDSVVASDEMLVIDWTSDQGNGRDVFAPRAYKTYDLAPPQVEMSLTGNVISLTANGLALFTAIEADVAGRFSQNVFDILPGETVTTTFTPTNPADTPQFTLRDLHSATTA